MQRTLFIIKPDAVKANAIGAILTAAEQQHGFQIAELKMLSLSSDMVAEFYAEHVERSFFGELAAFMTSGPVVVGVFARDDAVVGWREAMGHTDPKKADAGSLRAKYGASIESNALHGSDSLESAKREIGIFFPA